MNSSRSFAAVIAIALMLAPASVEISGEGPSANVVLAGNKPTYPPCAFAAKGKTCFDGHGLVSGRGRGGWQRRH